MIAGKPSTGETLRELVALNLGNPVSRPHSSHESGYLHEYCSAIMVGVFTDCVMKAKIQQRLPCYHKKYCAAYSKFTGGGPDVSVKGYAKDMLYLMVQIQYLDRLVNCKNLIKFN